MDERDFLNVVFYCNRMFISAIETGAQWEVAAQVFIAQSLKKGFGVMGREIKYPNSNRKAVDLGFQKDGVNYAVEIKVESASDAGKFAGVSLKKAYAEDSEKLKNFNMPNTVKWLVFVAYTAPSKKKLNAMGEQGLFTRVEEEVPFVAAILRV